MRNIVTKEYVELLSRKLFIEQEMKRLPVGYISKKTIKGKVQFYLQHRVGSKVVGSYIRSEEVDQTSGEIEKRKNYMDELADIEIRLTQLEQAAALINKDLYCKLSLYKLSYKMDDLESAEKQICSSFGSAMNAIEGVPVSTETHEEIEKWKRGDESFLTVFEDTLRRYGFPVEVRE